MKIRIIATGQEGEHKRLFPNTCFAKGNKDITPEWLLTNGCEKVVVQEYVPTIEELQSQVELQEQSRIAQLWQAAHEYEFKDISGSAIGLLAMGVMQGKPKCIAVQNWIKGIWTEYYIRKVGTSTDYDFSIAGTCPHTVPELMEELGV